MSRPRGQVASAGDGGATISVTCVLDGRSHSVPDEELAMGVGSRDVHYAALCGHVVTPAPMVAPDGELCPACAERDRGPRRRRRIRFGRR